MSARPAEKLAIAVAQLNSTVGDIAGNVEKVKRARLTAAGQGADLVAAAGSFDEAYSWVSRALSKELVTVGILREAMAARTRIRWRAWLAEALADADDGAYFPLERRYARG